MSAHVRSGEGVLRVVPWLRTNGVNTNGAAAKVMSFDIFWRKRKVHPGTFRNIKAGSPEYAKSPSVKKHQFKQEKSSDPMSADHICPFPSPHSLHTIYIYIYRERERDIDI